MRRSDPKRVTEISIHALREEGDRCSRCWSRSRCYFYPRPPRGGRPTSSVRHWTVTLFLSTPSARRATGIPVPALQGIPYFYPRPPRGGRRYKIITMQPSLLFLSTPSARRATALYVDQSLLSEISIHALREEGDQPHLFLSTFFPISIHALREEGDRKLLQTSSVLHYFYPRPPRGGRRR